MWDSFGVGVDGDVTTLTRAFDQRTIVRRLFLVGLVLLAASGWAAPALFPDDAASAATAMTVAW